MARMKLRFLFFVVFMVLFGFAGAASSAEVVVVDVVAATQYESLFVAGVVAHGGTDLDVQLSVDGASLGEPDKISKVEYDQLHNLTLWKIVYNHGDVVMPGQTLTATVSDVVSGASGDKTVTCRRGLLRLRQRAVCY